MTTEAGTQGCLGLMRCKEHLEEALLAVQDVANTEHIQSQLLGIHSQVEGMHELLRRKARERIAAAMETLDRSLD